MITKRIRSLTSSLLECAVCGEELKDPRTLSCGHIFCLTCIEQQASQSASKVQFTCVCCHKLLWLPGGGSHQLPKNLLAFNVIKLLAGDFTDDADTSLTARRCAIEQGLAQAAQEEMSSPSLNRASSEYVSASTEVGRMVECDLCAQQYDDPRLLDCGHTFCLRCLNCQVSETQRKMQVSCALCTRITWLTSAGLKEMAKNLVAHNIIHILTSRDADDSVKDDNQGVEQPLEAVSCKKPSTPAVPEVTVSIAPAEVIDTTSKSDVGISSSVKSVSKIEVKCSCCNTVLRTRAHFRPCGHRCCLRCSQNQGQSHCKECARIKSLSAARQAELDAEVAAALQAAAEAAVATVQEEVVVEKSKEPPTMQTVNSVTNVSVTCSSCGADISRSAAASHGSFRACGHRCCLRCQASKLSCKICARANGRTSASVKH